MNYYTCITALSLLALSVLCILISEDDRIKKENKKLFYLTYLFIALSAAAEWTGLRLDGVETLHGGTVPDFNDHRIPMAMAIAATMADAPVKILGAQCVSKSYPDFFEVYEALGGKLTRE